MRNRRSRRGRGRDGDWQGIKGPSMRRGIRGREKGDVEDDGQKIEKDGEGKMEEGEEGSGAETRKIISGRGESKG